MSPVLTHVAPFTRSSLFLAAICCCVALLFTAHAHAFDDEVEVDDYDETARVARVTHVEGIADLRRKGSGEVEDQSERVTRNLSLVEGDIIQTTGSEARVEIQLDAANFVRLRGNTIVRLTTLRDEAIVLSLDAGAVQVRLDGFDASRGYFEIDAPNITVALERSGLYRLDVEPEGYQRLTVRDGGEARLYSEADGFTVRSDRTAERFFTGTRFEDWNLIAALPRDYWDEWSDKRDAEIARRRREREAGRDNYAANVWGADELGDYGDWLDTPEYGRVWRPSTSATGIYTNWSPYRYGRWQWSAPYGWTWVADEPWGWATYHHGRWVYYRNAWCWTASYPAQYASYNRPYRLWSRWRPALVAFFSFNFGNNQQVCWRPLVHGEHDPRARNYGRGYGRGDGRGNGRDNRPRNPSPQDLRAVRDPAVRRALTTQPLADFGKGRHSFRPATSAQADIALNSEPVRGRLPVTPRNVIPSTTPNNQTPPATNETRPRGRDFGRGGDRNNVRNPAVALPTIGAAPRVEGQPLDAELRRRRMFRGRDVRPISRGERPDRTPNDNSPNVAPAITSPVNPNQIGDTNGTINNTPNTGVIVRPDVPRRARSPRIGNAPNAGGGTTVVTPNNPVTPDADNNNPSSKDAEREMRRERFRNRTRENIERPVRAPVEIMSPPNVNNAPASPSPSSGESPRFDNNEDRRPRARERERDDFPSRSERPARSERPPREEQPPRNEQPRRNEQPQSERPSRNEQPQNERPSRDEQPRPSAPAPAPVRESRPEQSSPREQIREKIEIKKDPIDNR
ncbi:MAG: hypothetical protein MSG64_01465 [Pyrinomonadaceae bacterium MAG19_C2-C3]|nr:hypothetical protein [Pyrinomonadaceae bacterium MAG19_C2-C3]